MSFVFSTIRYFVPALMSSCMSPCRSDYIFIPFGSSPLRAPIACALLYSLLHARMCAMLSIVVRHLRNVVYIFPMKTTPAITVFDGSLSILVAYADGMSCCFNGRVFDSGLYADNGSSTRFGHSCHGFLFEIFVGPSRGCSLRSPLSFLGIFPCFTHARTCSFFELRILPLISHNIRIKPVSTLTDVVSASWIS